MVSWPNFSGLCGGKLSCLPMFWHSFCGTKAESALDCSNSPVTTHLTRVFVRKKWALKKHFWTMIYHLLPLLMVLLLYSFNAITKMEIHQSQKFAWNIGILLIRVSDYSKQWITWIIFSLVFIVPLGMCNLFISRTFPFFAHSNTLKHVFFFAESCQFAVVWPNSKIGQRTKKTRLQAPYKRAPALIIVIILWRRQNGDLTNHWKPISTS